MKRFTVLIAFILIALWCVAQGYSLTVYTVPSTYPIDFSSPRRLLLSSTRNSLVLHRSTPRYNMGHVFIELKGPSYHTLTGSSKERIFMLGAKEFFDGYGLGLLFHGFPGRLDEEKQLLYRIAFRYFTGEISYITFILNQTTFQRLVDYLGEYRACKDCMVYNGYNRPRECLGAGCTAFGVSFLEVAGVVQSAWDSLWTHTVKVPASLIGGPLTGNKVSALNILAAGRWADDDEPYRIFKIYDPALIHQWIHQTWYNESAGEKADFISNGLLCNIPVKKEKRKNALGLVYDCRTLPTPIEPLFAGSIRQ